MVQRASSPPAAVTAPPPSGPGARPRGTRREVLSLAEARRIALRAQGLDARRRPAGPVTMRHFQQVVDRLGLLQIDSVNVLARAHLMPAFSRLGPYDTALLDRASGSAPRRLVETWAHEASFVPPATYRLLGWRRRFYAERDWGTVAGVRLQDAPILEEVRALVAQSGPVTARQAHEVYEAEHPRTRSGWWEWTVAKRALEYLFFVGEVGSARRTDSFERCYDLTERILPVEVASWPEPSDDEAVRALVEIGARAHGIGTAACFADYFRLKRTHVRDHVATAMAELVESGVLVPVTVRGWDRPTFVHRDVVLPRSVSGRALLSPFDPLVFERRRLEELFGTRYRIEIYVPAAQRVHGYYVLPFLLGDSIAARVDLKADRRAGVLRVQGAHREPGAPSSTADELIDALGEMAGWLGLDGVEIAPDAPGDLTTDLRTGTAGFAPAL
ncbi:winged helix-turn-helix domain-containing protein [Actinotalea sp.]|uniref:winged helix-turn-helix domain-containing protein n=1 Tax=Actinotalea sp. TaxID=1872145 RepID=UPI0035664FD1